MTSTNSRVVTKLKEIWYSPSDQYTILKILVALPIGLLLGVGKFRVKFKYAWLSHIILKYSISAYI